MNLRSSPARANLWKQGYSAGVIARHITAEFEGACTKNRIIGIMHRYPRFDPHPEPTGMKRLSWYLTPTS